MAFGQESVALGTPYVGRWERGRDACYRSPLGSEFVQGCKHAVRRYGRTVGDAPQAVQYTTPTMPGSGAESLAGQNTHQTGANRDVTLPSKGAPTKNSAFPYYALVLRRDPRAWLLKRRRKCFVAK